MSRLSNQYERAAAEVDGPYDDREADLRARRAVAYRDVVGRISAHLADNPPDAGFALVIQSVRLAGWRLNRFGDSPNFFIMEDGRILKVEYNQPSLFEFTGGSGPYPDRYVFGLLHDFAADGDIDLEHETDATAWGELYDNPPEIERQRSRRHWWQRH